ncbi:metallophosphoesterase family protein [Bacillus sp. 03113]|uniref:metallophosphoesterase family protein n=1 Tax=Bacillus sp. 03113 TaxID=2578211 RepID=UPI001141EAE8|nr:metallophosphoesterase [Bacillus sp. 03113]
MRILIVSDSHGLDSELSKLRDRHRDEVELFIHCGDSELAYDDKELNGYVKVRGNCDYDSRFPNEVLEDVGGFKLFATHGHLYSVKSSLMKLSYRAKELNAAIACFGHSHELGAELIDNILFINPGSIRLPRGRKEKTYVILDIVGNKLLLHVYDIQGGEIEALRKEFTF